MSDANPDLSPPSDPAMANPATDQRYAPDDPRPASQSTKNQNDGEGDRVANSPPLPEAATAVVDDHPPPTAIPPNSSSRAQAPDSTTTPGAGASASPADASAAAPESAAEPPHPHPPGESDASSEPKRANPRRRQQKPLLTREQVLSSLLALSPAIVFGKISREVAATIRTILDTYLRHLGPSTQSQPGDARVDMPGLRRLTSVDPTILDVIGDMLSDEQFEDLFYGTPQPKGDEDNPAA